ncbi:MAG: hypothetical protein P8179_16140 [Candidatus Thiodiazotropha sp.]|jgi:hypothetical protein
MKVPCIALAGLALAAFSLSVTAEDGDPAAYCKQAAKLYEESDIAGAVEEARWCLDSLEQIQQSRKSAKFAQQVAGWERGEISQQKAMGFAVIETEYSRGDKVIEVSYSSGGGMGAMFSQMGMAAGGKKLRLGGYTGLITEEGSQNEIMIGLKRSSGMLNLSTSSASMEELSAFAKAFPVKDIDQ